MTSEKRIRLSPETRRAQLIKLGVEMLATRTLDELSVDDIARQAGISRGLLFHYFASKHEFHVEVARAAAAELLARTAPDRSRAPLEALAGSIEAFISCVEENPDGYRALVRGAVSGDNDMRAIFTQTRESLAGRVVAIVGESGFTLGPLAVLAVHGWVAYVEECTVRWIEHHPVSRADLLDLLTKSLPAMVLAATQEEAASLMSILAPNVSLAGN